MGATEIGHRLDYFYCCIGEFAARHSISNAAAYKYLDNYKGLDFIYNNYEIEHTQSIEDAVEDMTRICLRHGGTLS